MEFPLVSDETTAQLQTGFSYTGTLKHNNHVHKQYKILYSKKLERARPTKLLRGHTEDISTARACFTIEVCAVLVFKADLTGEALNSQDLARSSVSGSTHLSSPDGNCLELTQCTFKTDSQ